MYHIAFMVREERDESRPYGSRPKDEPTTAQGIGAFAYCEIFVQTARLFRVRIFFVANKPSISRFVKNRQTTDNQSLAQSWPFLVPQKHPKTPQKAT